jgi:ABC-type dipeptide/oligopeptide/nickel transport system permease component
MLRYLMNRILGMIPLLIVITAFTFIVGQYGSGDLAAYLAGTRSDPSKPFDPVLYQQFRKLLGEDQPIYVRYVNWLWNALHGDFGKSYVMMGDPPISYLLTKSVPQSLELCLAALFLVTIIGVPLGILAAVFNNSLIDTILVSGSSILSSVPTFVLAPIAMIVVVVKLHLLPSVGVGWHGLFSRDTILPAFCLAAVGLLNVVRTTRVSMLEVLSQEYVRASRARGLSEWSVVTQHVIRNALTPVITVLGMTAPLLLGATVFIEQIFNIQGFGLMMSNGLQRGDILTVTAATLVSTTIVMTFNLAVDLVYGLIDPRVRLSK